LKEDYSKYIGDCFKLAQKAKGSVSPNPLVGCIILKYGKVIGKGYHKKSGDAHAEVNAIKSATETVAGSTLYCSLEPCCHTNKKTPPCVPLVINKKIKKVVISNLDPNKNVNGKGVKQLREAGIEVVTGILEDEGKELNKFYFKFVQEKLPFVTLKIAQSIDGKISEAKNKQTWLTGKESIKFVHKLRSEFDAVLVGSGTIKVDDPQLNVREFKGRNPVRVILDGKLSIPIKSNIFNSVDPENTWLFVSESANGKKVKKIADRGIKIFSIRGSKQYLLDLKKILKVLAENKITSVLVEGGANIFKQFLEEELYDEIIILQSPKILGKGIGISDFEEIRNLQLKSVDKLGIDIKLVFGKKLSD
jgi:diaminohydroxyphosphoribosylaminopyrimidine deaminase / 5-amino-6-(5-phosphoribosylamino)uracil reductase